MASKKEILLQGEVWLFDPDPVKGNELGKKVRPALIISNDLFNEGPSGLVIIVPLTSKDKGIPSHVEILPSDGAVKEKSFAMCEQIRCVSKKRFVKRWGKLSSKKVLENVNSWLQDLLWVG